MATISDVARQAGVSETTVSHALNGTRRVSDELRARVLTAAAALEYRPDVAARSLRTGRSQTLALLLPDITNPWHPLLARGMLDVTTPEGYHTLLCATDWKIDQEATFLADLIQRRVDGIALMSMQYDLEGLRRALRGTPAVLFSRPDTAAGDLDYLYFDQDGAARLAVAYLIERGARRIATITGPLSNGGARERLQGYHAALAEAGLPGDPALVVEGDYWLPSGTAAAIRLLDLQPRPDAIFAANDLMALGALRALHQAGVSVPGEMAVVGFDDIPEAEIACPQLTTVRQPAYEMGRQAGLLLLRRLRRELDNGQAARAGAVLRIEPVLVRRDTA